MLTEEFNARLSAAQDKFHAQAYEDMVRKVHAMELKPCSNIQALWMFALESYNPVPGAVNPLTERHLHGLFCRMGADGAVPVPTPPPVLPPVLTFNANFAWVEVNPWPAITGGTDTTVYQVTQEVAVAGLMAFNIASVPINRYLVVRYPDTQPVKTAWNNDTFNYGTLPDSVFQAMHTGGGYRYIGTRIPVSLNPAQTLKFT